MKISVPVVSAPESELPAKASSLPVETRPLLIRGGMTLEFTAPGLSPVETVRLVVLTALAAGACAWDLSTRRVPNWLTVPAAAAGLILALAEGGWSGGAWSLAGLAAGGGALLPVVALGKVGAGDMKLTAAAGALLGPLGAVRGVLAGAVLGGFWALGWLAVKKDRKITLPYAPPLAAGIVIAFFL